MQIHGGRYGPPLMLVEPGCCALCKTTPIQQHQGIIDTGVRFYGAHHQSELNGLLYICESCATRLGELVGMVHRDVAAELEDENEVLAQLTRDLFEQYDEYKALIRMAKRIARRHQEEEDDVQEEG